MTETNYRIQAWGEEEFWKAAWGMWDMPDVSGLMLWECRDCDDEYTDYKDNERMKFSWFVSRNIGVGSSELPLQKQKGGHPPVSTF